MNLVDNTDGGVHQILHNEILRIALKEETRRQEASSAEQTLKEELKIRSERLNQLEREKKVSATF